MNLQLLGATTCFAGLMNWIVDINGTRSAVVMRIICRESRSRAECPSRIDRQKETLWKGYSQPHPWSAASWSTKPSPLSSYWPGMHCQWDTSPPSVVSFWQVFISLDVWKLMDWQVNSTPFGMPQVDTYPVIYDVSSKNLWVWVVSKLKEYSNRLAHWYLLLYAQQSSLSC